MNEHGKFYIYTIFNKINGKIYIGKTIDPDNRWRAHLCSGRAVYSTSYDVHNKDFYRELFSFGEPNFTFSVLQVFDTEHHCFEAEKFWVSHFRSHNKDMCYNKMGGGTGTTHSKETKQKLSQIKNKLSMDDASKVRHIYLTTDDGQEELAIKFGISITTISGIVNNKLYRIDDETYPHDLVKEKKKRIMAERAGNRVLSADQVSQIRVLYETSQYTYETLAKQFDVVPNTISYAVNNVELSELTKQAKSNNIARSLLKCGERSSTAKLTDEQAEGVRNLFATGKYTKVQLSRLYDLDQTSIADIISGKSYKPKL